MLAIWNTPAPLDLSLCLMEPARQRFYAVEMDKLRGITFFFSGIHLCGIHPHLTEESCATTTYKSFSDRFRRETCLDIFPHLEGRSATSSCPSSKLTPGR